MRASYAAVGCPAEHVVPALGSHNGLTAAMLVRFSKLKPSAINSMLNRSPSGIRLETRRSKVKNPGPVNALRPRLPIQPAGGVTLATVNVVKLLVRQTSATPKCTAGMNCEV